MIHELFEAQVEQTPDAVAVVFEGNKLTYRELNTRADNLARQLRVSGVGPNILVALFLDRSFDMVIGMLAVLKAGGCYVPLDPIYPQKRLAYMLADAQPLVLVTQKHLQAKLPVHRSLIVVIDADVPAAEAHEPTVTSRQAAAPSDLAYVIYTSGSTGEPKGVEIEHRAVINMLASMRQSPGICTEDTLLAITTVTFDIAVLEIFLPLVCGARVVIATSKTTSDGVALAALMEECGASILQATPSTLQMLLDAGWTGAPRLKILCGGEAWTIDLAHQLLARCGSLWNMYGPTETTVWSAVAEVKAAQPVVIGLPIANTRFYVLDGGRQLVPVGVPGELYIGGAGLARGYRNLPKITNDRFLADPFTRAPGPKMYRTGDLVRRLPDGKLEFLGRLDHQLKIRGYRIELGEIETVLERHPNIERCVVVARQDARGDKRLIAYIIPVARTNISTPDLRLFLAETVPSYMIPAAFVSLASFPLLPNGKLDRKALPSPDDSAEEANVVPIQPRTLTEELLAGIWCEMLNVGHVGLRDNFFELGGHSLLAMRVIGKINQKLNVHLNVPVFFQNPTIELLAKALEQNRILLPGPQIVPLQSGNTGLPLYFVDARPLEFKIGQSIGEHRSIFAINGPMPVDWLMSIEAAEMSKLPTIEQLGERYGDAIRAHARSSACIVAGYSFSGKLAFETARKLKQAGGNVAFVLLIDSAAWQGGQNIGTLFRRSWQWIWSDAEANAIHQTRTPKLYAQLGNSSRLLLWLLGRIPQLMEHHLARLQTADDENFSGTIDTNGNPVEWRFVEKFYRLVAKSFDPRPLDAAAVLLRARVEGKEQIPGYDFTNGWGGLFTGGIEILQATGDHLTMVHDERHLVPLAAQIDDLLGKDKRISEPTEKAPRERRAY